MTPAEEKSILRIELLSRRASITGCDRKICDDAIMANIAASELFDRSELIWSYATDGTEPDLSGLLTVFAGKKRFFYPRYRAADKRYEMVEIASLRQMTTGKYGIAEPAPELPALTAAMAFELAEKSSFCRLIPLVGCDLHGNRLGRGKGFYDRLLADYPGSSLGIMYECQLAEAVPHEAHDRRLDGLVTERRTIKL